MGLFADAAKAYSDDRMSYTDWWLELPELPLQLNTTIHLRNNVLP
jgi:hypothetical protein